jgi:uncharacterized membrane protein
MTFGKKTLFFLLLGFCLLASILELTHVNFFYTTTLISFCTCILLPGFLISLILRIRKLSFWENLSFIVGLSIAFLEFGGLLLNILLPLFNVKNPLAFQNIIYGFDVFLLLLFVSAWVRTKQLEVNIQFLKRSNIEKLLYILPVFFPILATLGAIVLNNGGSDILTLILLGAIATYSLLLVLSRDKIAIDLYPYAIFFIGIASLFTTSLRSWYITGHDIEREFYVFQLTNTHHIWNMTFYQDAYNACLSITILPTVLTNLLSIQDIYVYKVVFQILFATSPVLVFFIIRNYTTPALAFLSAFFFMSFPTFFNDMPMLNRQEIGFIFFGLVVYMMLLSELSLLMRKILFIIFALSVIVSHYSTNFVLLALVTFVYVLTLIISLPFVKNTLAWLLSKSHLTLKNTSTNWYASEDTTVLPQIPQADHSPKTHYPKMFLRLPQIPRADRYSKTTSSQRWNNTATWYANQNTTALPRISRTNHSPKRSSDNNLKSDYTLKPQNGWLRYLRKGPKTHYSKVFLSLPMIFLLFSMTYFWNNLYTNSSSHAGSVISEVVSDLLVQSNADTKSSDVSYSILSAPKTEDPKQEFQAYINSILQPEESANEEKVDTNLFYSRSITNKYPSYPVPQDELPPTPLGNLLTTLHIPVFNIQAESRSLSADFMQIFVFIGLIAVFFFKNKKPFDMQYLLLCFGAIFLLFLLIVLPALSVEYGLLRMFQQLLFVLSLPIVLALNPILFFVKEQKRIIFTGIIAMIFFLNLTGFISHLTGDYYPQLTLDNSGLYYDTYYVHKSDVLAIVWLSMNNVNNEPIEADSAGMNKLPTYGDISVSNEIFPPIIQKNAYVYLELSSSTIVSLEDDTTYNSPKPFLDNNKNLIYSNGKNNIYK